MDPRPIASRRRSMARALVAAAWLLSVGSAGAVAAAVPSPDRVAPAGLEPDPDWRPREPMDAAHIALALQRLRVLASGLYVGAHPDDENTAFLAYLAEGRLARAAYLSMTRGDGGQNLIGREIGVQLGVIRTQELLAARSVDGAEQYFTRALDFGYSKSGEETLDFWGKDSILSDVVWVIRAYRPDVVFTRFPPDARAGHGHHTASAVLAEEAFQAAGDSTRFPWQLQFVKPWRPRRLLWNVFRGDTSAAPGGPPVLRLDLGGYQPLLGRSFTEIAGESRSMHKSQGFGAPERRGPNLNYFMHRQGEPANRDPFDGVETGWSRVRGGAAVDRWLLQAERDFDPERPQAILPSLLRAHAELSKLSGDPWIEIKRRELVEVMSSCAGLWVEAVASRPTASPGESLRVVVSALERLPAGLTLENEEFPFGVARREAALALIPNQPIADTVMVPLPDGLSYSQPYWLEHRARKGRFVLDPALVGHAQSAPAMMVGVTLRAGDQRLALEAPVVYRWTDPVAGERYRPFVVTPPVTIGFDEEFYAFPARSGAYRVRLRIEGADRAVEGRVRLDTPSGFVVEPQDQPIQLEMGGHTHVEFLVRPGASAPASGVFRAVARIGGRDLSYGLVTIDHPHIPIQVLFPPAEARFVCTPIERRGEEIGYVMGSGDEGPSALRQLGWHVTMLTDQDLDWGDLSRFHTIVTGVRAWNTREPLSGGSKRLLDYVFEGGTLLVQYNTASEGLGERIGPRPFTITRDRVTVEEAPVEFDPRDPLLAAPNPITAADFEGWVQERGLYFASRRDSSYRAVLSSHDPGEPPLDGGLITTSYGRGLFIYTGYAFFRQLPACVPGAYRLLANLVSAEPARPKGPERGR